MSKFEELFAINVNEHTEKKRTDDGKELTYLSWAWAWAEFKKRYPNAEYQIRTFDGKPWLCDESLGYLVMTSVTADGQTYEMWLPVMDYKNRAMKGQRYEYSTKYGKKAVEAASMMDINKAIMRCLVKNLSMFGLGLYIYAGEDLPEGETEAVVIEERSEPFVTAGGADYLANLARDTDTDVNSLFAYYKIKKWTDMTKEQFEACCAILEKRKKALDEATA